MFQICQPLQFLQFGNEPAVLGGKKKKKIAAFAVLSLNLILYKQQNHCRKVSRE